MKASPLCLLVLTGVSTAVVTGSAASLYWSATDSAGGHIVRANGDGSAPADIVSGAANVLGPNGVEAGAGRLFWPDQQMNAVRQANPDGTGAGTFASASNPYDVFVSGQRVFWTSQTGNFIDAQNLDGTDYQRILGSPDVTSPFAIEVTTDHIYWSEVSGRGRLLRSDRDGGNIVTLIPNVFVYDFQVTGEYIYLADNNYPGGVKRAKLDGTGIVTLADTGALFNGLCVTADAIYWSAFLDGQGGGIRRAGLDGSDHVSLYNSPPGTSVRGIVVLDGAVVPEAPLFTSVGGAAGEFSATLQVQPGTSYRIETTGSFAEWTVADRFVATGTRYTFTHPIPEGSQNFFVRAVIP